MGVGSGARHKTRSLSIRDAAVLGSRDGSIFAGETGCQTWFCPPSFRVLVYGGALTWLSHVGVH